MRVTVTLECELTANECKRGHSVEITQEMLDAFMERLWMKPTEEIVEQFSLPDIGIRDVLFTLEVESLEVK